MKKITSAQAMEVSLQTKKTTKQNSNPIIEQLDTVTAEVSPKTIGIGQIDAHLKDYGIMYQIITTFIIFVSVVSHCIIFILNNNHLKDYGILYQTFPLFIVSISVVSQYIMFVENDRNSRKIDFEKTKEMKEEYLMEDKVANVIDFLEKIDMLAMKQIFKELVIEIGPNNFRDLSKVVEGGQIDKYKLRIIDIIITRKTYRKEDVEARIINSIIFTHLANLEHGLILLMDLGLGEYTLEYRNATIGLNYFAEYIASCQKDFKANIITIDPSRSIFKRFDMEIFKIAFEFIYKKDLHVLVKEPNSSFNTNIDLEHHKCPNKHILITYQMIQNYLNSKSNVEINENKII